MPERPNLHLSVAFDGAGWHPAAWRAERARPAELFSPGYWVDLAQEAERGLLDFVTFDDSLSLQWLRRGVPDDRTDQVRGRLDAVMVAARVAPATSSIGLVPVVTTTHVEPFHASKAIATLDYVSHGRAGFQARISGTSLEARLFGRREIADRSEADRARGVATSGVSDLFDEAADFVEVVRRLWDSWEDDAEIRDAATGRFVDRDKLHYIDFEGRWFSVKGPSITPRPPQGQPLVAALAHIPVAFALAARGADVVFVTPDSTQRAGELVATIRDTERAVGRKGPPLRILADLVVFLDADTGAAEARKAYLDELFGKPYRSDALVFVGSPTGLAELLVEWQAEGIEGFRLRPGALPRDLEGVTRQLVPLLQERGLFRRHRYDDIDLRDRMGLTRPLNRYVSA